MLTGKEISKPFIFYPEDGYELTFKFNFSLFYDYYEYWNNYNTFRLKVVPIFTTDWIDICGDDGFRLDNGGIAYMIAQGLVNKFNEQIPAQYAMTIDQLQVQDYY